MFQSFYLIYFFAVRRTHQLNEPSAVHTPHPDSIRIPTEAVVDFENQGFQGLTSYIKVRMPYIVT